MNLFKVSINLFHATGIFLYPLKTSKNQRFFDIFRGYRKKPVAWNGLKIPLALLWLSSIRYTFFLMLQNHMIYSCVFVMNSDHIHWMKCKFTLWLFCFIYLKNFTKFFHSLHKIIPDIKTSSIVIFEKNLYKNLQ